MHNCFYGILDVQEFYRQVCALGVYNFRMWYCQHLLWGGIFLVVSLESVKHQTLSAVADICRFRLSSQTILKSYFAFPWASKIVRLGFLFCCNINLGC